MKRDNVVPVNINRYVFGATSPFHQPAMCRVFYPGCDVDAEEPSAVSDEFFDAPKYGDEAASDTAALMVRVDGVVGVLSQRIEEDCDI